MSFTIKALLFLSLIPYVSIIEFPMDTTPYAVAFLLVIAFPVFIFHNKINKISKLDLFFLFVLITFVGIMSIRFFLYTDLDSFRVLGNYASFLLFFLFFAALSQADKKTKELLLDALSRLLLIVSFLYLAGSLLQLTSRLSGIEIFSEIIKNILSREGRTSLNRGFNSITAEPSYAGIVNSLIACIALFVYQHGYTSIKICKIIVGNCLIVALLSASATAIPFIIIAVFYAIKAFKIKTHSIVFILFLIVAPVIAYLFQTLEELRLINLINTFLISNGGGISEDVSAISRFASILNYSIPFLFGHGVFGNALVNVSDNYLIDIIRSLGLSGELSSLLEVGVIAEGGGIRTKSAISQSIFLFGVFSLFFWVFFANYLLRKARSKSGAVALPLIILTGYLIQIPLGHPSFCVAIGLILIVSRDHSSAVIGSDQNTLPLKA